MEESNVLIRNPLRATSRGDDSQDALCSIPLPGQSLNSSPGSSFEIILEVGKLGRLPALEDLARFQQHSDSITE